MKPSMAFSVAMPCRSVAMDFGDPRAPVTSVQSSRKYRMILRPYRSLYWQFESSIRPAEGIS